MRRRAQQPGRTGAELLRVCEERGISISDAMLLRERQWRDDEEIREGLLRIWRTMDDCIQRGIRTPGILPGGLEVKRRAASWYDSLSAEDPARLPMNSFEWVSLAALAVNEENAAGGRVVTGRCRSTSSTIQSMNTRSFALT